MLENIDCIIINDYGDKYRLSPIHSAIYREVKKNEKLFSSMDIIINRRYSKEILATRAGYAPNKPIKNNNVNTPCIYPFTDIVIFPDGKVGMCCNDCEESSNFGDVREESLAKIWHNEKFRELRNAMLTNDRRNYPFCKECDVVDAGGGEEQIRQEFTLQNL